MLKDTEDLDWNGCWQFDQERTISGLRHDAEAARLRENEQERADYLRQAEQLDALPRLWEFGVPLTLDEYSEAVRVRRWIRHEQDIALHERWVAHYEAEGLSHTRFAQWNAEQVAELRAKYRYYWSSDGHLLLVFLRDDGALTVNSALLTPEWAEQLRRETPAFTELLTRYEDNQAAGRGHGDLPLDSTPLPGPALPGPMRLWRERIENGLRRRAAEQAQTTGPRVTPPAADSTD
ncbi:hypothetical protein [Streptomyces sp. NPDC050287]|uniref:hypothetical protein n=1 Tax=Streptomyces sp. NPDC050287 TaxID=3365608 RepID=UPI00378F663B